MMLEKLRQEVFESLLELPKNRLVTMHSGTVSGRDPETGQYCDQTHRISL